MMRITDHDRIRVVTFTRPEARNPLSRAVLARLLDLLHMMEGAARWRGLVITGSGRVFASGADLQELTGFTPVDAEAYARLGARVLSCIARAPFPVVACVNGPAVGGALELAMAAHIRLATPDSFIQHPALRLGLLPAWMGARLWMHNVLGRHYRHLLFTGARIPAETALHLGVFHELHSADRLLPRALEILHRFQELSHANPPDAPASR